MEYTVPIETELLQLIFIHQLDNFTEKRGRLCVSSLLSIMESQDSSWDSCSPGQTEFFFVLFLSFNFMDIEKGPMFSCLGKYLHVYTQAWYGNNLLLHYELLLLLLKRNTYIYIYMLNKKTCNGIQLSIQSVYPVNYGTCRCTVAPVAPMRRPH